MGTCVRQSTAVDIKIGPFLDSTDGNTAETALTITQPDIRLAKNGAAWAQKNAAQTLSHEEAGWYEVSLDAIDTNTLGTLIVAIHKSGALPVWREFNVMPAQVWDSLFSTDLLQVHAAEMSAGLITAAAIATGALDADALAADAVAEIADGVWDEDATGHQTAGTFGQAIGDPGADTNTIYKAVVTDATGATVGVDVVALKAETSSIQTDTNDIQARVPAALVGGRIDASVGAMAVPVNLINVQGIKKNTALSNFIFAMYDAAGDPKAGEAVTAERSIDGAAFAACANSVVEISGGGYRINLAATDLNGDVIALKLSSGGAKTQMITITTVQA